MCTANLILLKFANNIHCHSNCIITCSFIKCKSTFKLVLITVDQTSYITSNFGMRGTLNQQLEFLQRKIKP